MNLTNCRLCSAELFPEPIISLNGMPKAAQYFPQANEFANDQGINLAVYQCSACGLVQLTDKPVDYYKEVITAASLSDKARISRLGQIIKFVQLFGLAGKKILEVGSGKGDMLDVLQEAGVTPTGIEASPESVASGKSRGRNLVNGYIGDIHIVNGHAFDAFVTLNYLEHQPDPGLIIQRIYNLTTPDAAGYVTVPNLDYLLQSNCFYEFVADHLVYFTQKTLTYAFEKNGFDVISCRTINNDNDVAAFVKKKKPLQISTQFGEVEALIKQLHEIIADYTAKNKKVAVWGAGHRTLALLALGQLDKIECVVDSAKFKQGKYTPVLHLNIVAPEELKEKKVDLVLVMVPGVYPDEVVNTLKGMHLSTEIAILRHNQIEFI